jgi:hypothetical protein
MSFQWLHMRIQEEKDRRKREAITFERLPSALAELHEVLKEGIAAYTDAFGSDVVEMSLLPPNIRIVTPGVQVLVTIAPEIPGFRIERGEHSEGVEVGLLPSNNLYYRDRELDVYLTLEDLTRRILDRALFPKLQE